MKTREELNALKEEIENLNKKLADLTEEELAQVGLKEKAEILKKKGVELSKEELEQVAGGLFGIFFVPIPHP